MSDYRQVIPWYIIKRHLKTLADETAGRAFTEGDDKELFRLQGEYRLLKKLENLPETLMQLDEADEEEKKNGANS